jgi:cyclopropane-fatty-acyl-phospholipid synthase
MTYSSALFSAPDQSLEDAQVAKLDRIAALLDLRGGESILEIGIGWGGLAERLLQTSDCSLYGVTLSARQLEFAQQRLAGLISSGRCDLRLQDYRDVDGPFDRIVSIEMLEAVGEAYWPVYFEKLRSNLKPGGRAVLQVITIDEARFAGYRRNPDFIQQRIFPGGMLPTRALIAEHASRAGLRPAGEELFGDSYARTLEIWKQRFEAAWPEIEPLGFDEPFRRMWSYYLDYCRVGFEAKAIDVGLYVFERP